MAQLYLGSLGGTKHGPFKPSERCECTASGDIQEACPFVYVAFRARTAFTLLGIFLFEQARDPDYKIEVIAAMAILGLHELFVALSVYFWITEKETVLMVENDADSGEE